MRFSIVLIAKNEALTLPRLLKSLAEFQARGGEVILVDTGSVDKTVEIARGLGCAVFKEGDGFSREIDAVTARSINRKFKATDEEPIVRVGDKLFDYSAARNFAASCASNDTVWMPDCDEEFTVLDLDAVEAAITDGAGRLEYDFIFAHDEFGRPALRFTHSKCYNRNLMQWKGIVHEVLAGSAKTVGLPSTQVLLEHWQKPSEGRGRYLAGLALDCYENPHNDRNSHYFARELLWNNRPKSAIQEFERHIAMNAWLPEKAQSMIFIGDALLMLGREDSALASYHRAFDTDGSRREALIRLAEYYYRKGDHAHTAAYANAALTVPWNSYYANQVAHYEHWPHEMLYWALWYLGDKEGSKYHFDKAYAYLPHIEKYQAARKLYYPEKKTDLEWTGERYIPGKTPLVDVETEHLARYRFAEAFTSGLVVLDAACGDGYGKTILNSYFYQGVDIEPLAVEIATKKYGDGFFVADLEKNLSKDFESNVVVSFETIEHLSDPHPFLKWTSENCNLFIGSIPLDMPSEFHKQVYSEREAMKLIRQYWSPDHVGFYTQQGAMIDRRLDDYQYLLFVCGPKVSIVIPTLGREDKLRRLEDLIAKNAGYPNYEVIVEHDSFNARQGAPKTLKRGVERSTGEMVMFLGNDCVPRPGFLLKALKAMIRNFPELDGLVGLNDGYWHGEFATHWLASKKLLAPLGGEFFHTGYKHIGCDNELTERCRLMGKYVWAKEAEVYHDHPVQTGFKPEDMDDIYRLAYDPDSVEADKQLLQERGKQFGFAVPEFYSRPEVSFER